MKIRQKFVLILGVPILGMLLLVTHIIQEKWRVLDAAQQTQHIVKIGQQIAMIAHHSANVRGLSAGFLGSKRTPLGEQLRHQRELLDGAIKEYQQQANRWYPDDQLLKQRLVKLSLVLQPMDAGVDSVISFDDYSEINTHAIQLIDFLSHRVADEHLSGSFRAHTAALWIKERMGQERGMLNGLFARGEHDEASLVKIYGYLADQETWLPIFQSNLSSSQLALWERERDQFDQKRYLKMRDTVLNRDPAIVTVEPKVWFSLATRRIDVIDRVAKRIYADIQRYAVELNGGAREVLLTTTILMLTVVLISLFIAIRMAREVIHGIENISDSMQKVIEGEDYTQQITHLGEDEVGALGTTFNQLSDVLRQKNSESERYVRQLSESEAQFRAIMGSINKAIVSIDNRGEIVFWSRGAERIFGYTDREIRGLGLSTIIPQRYHASHQHAIHRVATGGKPKLIGTSVDSVDIEGLHKEGHEFPVSLALSSWYKNGVIHFSGVLSDISGRKAQETLLQQAKQDAEAANSAKDEFLASMSHELRTPLTSIIGNCELMAEQEVDEEKRRLIRTVVTSGQGLLALVNDILDMSKIESGKFTIDESHYDLSALLEDLRQLFSIRAQDAGIEFLVELREAQPYQLIGDGQRIGQILINLIGNAIKFTESGEVSLGVWSADGYLFFKVEDTGIGILPETMDQLFQRFEQADGSISRSFGGAGLGLYISDVLATLMGGHIDASSQVGKGSIFQLVLPYRPSETPVDQPLESVDRATVLSTKYRGRVLIAEDTPELQQLERRILESMGVDVVVASNGEEAIEQVRGQSFDLILMDMQMPVMDGIAATERLRAEGNLTPIVALTANVMQKHRDAFNQAGCSGFLSKPIDRHELGRFLSQYLSSNEKVATPPSTGRAVVADRETEVDDELMAIFAQSAVTNKAALMVAISAKDWVQLHQIAHAIKGSGSSFGYPELTHLGKAVCDAIDQGEEASVSPLVMDLIIGLGRVISVAGSE
ncbi:MAG: response regulator [Gammaproteobacteria bacterium]|nr:response regulator [Gammaproteobacteria bacterium]